MPLPGLVGSGPLWLRACRRGRGAPRARASGWWSPASRGVGKLALVRAVQQRRHPVRHFDVLDAADAGSTPGWFRSLPGRRWPRLTAAWSSGTSTASTPVRLRELVAALGSARRTTDGSPPWVAVTVGPGRASDPDPATLLRLFPSTVEVPPLRHHLEDMPRTGAVLPRPARPQRPPDLLAGGDAALMRASWPGNARAVLEVLREVVRAPTYRHDHAGRPAAGGPRGQPPPSQPARGHASATRSCGPWSTQAATRPGPQLPRDVPGDDLPQDPRLRHHALPPVGPPPPAAVRDDRRRPTGCPVVRVTVTGVMLTGRRGHSTRNLRSRNLRKRR